MLEIFIDAENGKERVNASGDISMFVADTLLAVKIVYEQLKRANGRNAEFYKARILELIPSSFLDENEMVGFLKKRAEAHDITDSDWN